jgi:hypothetical protein
VTGSHSCGAGMSSTLRAWSGGCGPVATAPTAGPPCSAPNRCCRD